MNGKAFFLVTLLLLVPAVSAFDLSDYPLPYVLNGKFIGVLVIGDDAAAGDTIGAVEIATSLQYLVQNRIETPVKLASEIDDIKQENVIVVGGPCANTAAAQLLDFPQDCMEGFWGASVIQLHENNGNVQIIVAGGSELDTRRAARMLASYGSNADVLNGTHVEVRKAIGSATNLNVDIEEDSTK